VHYPGDRRALEPLLDQVADELNVKSVLFAESAERFGRWRAKPSFRALGPRLGSRVRAVAEALAEDDGRLGAALAAGERVVVPTPDGDVPLGPDDVELVQETSEGWGVASDGGLTVALELELTGELRREGLARELVRAVQEARKAAGLEVADRIALGVDAAGPVDEALAAFGDEISAETLAVELVRGRVGDPTFELTTSLEGAGVTVTLRRA
jgi:isoleucyl-tRNA synthetase